MKTKSKTTRASVFLAPVLAMLLALTLFGCTSTSTITASSTTGATTDSASGKTKPPDWPTNQKAAPLNPCTQCKCPDLLNDSQYTSQVVFDNQRGYRYAEAFITCPTPPSQSSSPSSGQTASNSSSGQSSSSGQTNIGIFNTTGFNIQADNSRDSIPNVIDQNYSDSTVAQDYGATSVFMEETRYWMMDKLRIILGNNVRNLDGLDTRFGAFTAAAPSANHSAVEFKPTTVTRNSTFYFDAGKPVFILDAPNGMTFIQQSWVLSAGSFQSPSIQSLLTLPSGWKWRTETLPKDLTINGITANGADNQWQVTQDNLGDSYSACWTSNGKSSCNYTP